MFFRGNFITPTDRVRNWCDRHGLEVSGGSTWEDLLDRILDTLDSLEGVSFDGNRDDGDGMENSPSRVVFSKAGLDAVGLEGPVFTEAQVRDAKGEGK
jgi:hypothetical protein